jgi:hypothetical protein
MGGKGFGEWPLNIAPYPNLCLAPVHIQQLSVLFTIFQNRSSIVAEQPNAASTGFGWSGMRLRADGVTIISFCISQFR